MSIYFKKIRWKNFLSTGNLFTEIDLSSKDMTLIIGQNGAGKSTILDALSFVLFGKPFRKINKPQLVNSITNKACVCEVEFSIGTNEYKIVRGIKPNVFEVYKDEKLLNQSAEMRDYQEILEKQILKANHKSFCQIVILGSATFQPFMQLAAAARREVIEDILDLQIFTTMNWILKDRVSQNNGELTDVISEVRHVEDKIKLISSHASKIRSDKDKEIAEKRDRIAATREEMRGHIAEANALKEEIASLHEKLANDDFLDAQLKKYTALRHQIGANKNTLEQDVMFFMNHDTCPTCKQEIEEEFKKSVLEEKRGKIEHIQEGLTTLVEKMSELEKAIDESTIVKNQIRDKKMDLHVVTTKLTGLAKYIGTVEDDIKKLETVSEEDDYLGQIEQLKADLENARKKQYELEDNKIVYSAAAALLKDGGIKARIIKQYVPIINKLINKYLAAMDFFVSFELDEQFNETIKSRHRDAFTYASFSEGEKQKIDLALLFTWRAIAKLRNSISTNLLIMDEVFDSSLDQNATDFLMNIVRDVSKDSNVIIISHKDHMNEKFTNVLRFVKNKNFSQLENR